jgi:hypothetical protein
MKENIILEVQNGKRTFFVDDYEVLTGHNLDFLVDDPVDISDEARLLMKINTFKHVCQSITENLMAASKLIEDIKQERRRFSFSA